MKIGFDIRLINNSGIGTTIRGFLDHISPQQRSQMILFGSKNENHQPDVSINNYPVYGFRQHLGYGRLLNRSGLDLFHMPHYDVPFAYRGPLVITVHDLIHFLFPKYSTKPFTRFYSKWMIGNVVQKARKIIVVSKNTQRDLEHHFPQSQGKTVVIYPAVDSQFRPLNHKECESVLNAYSLKPGYLLYVGNIRPSKNSINLIKAYLSLCQERKEIPSLVMVGANSYKNLESIEGIEQIRFIHHVKYEHLPALYSASKLFVFPSVYEGFGLPPLEAMACGVPVLVSSASSLPEVCDDAARYFPGLTQYDIAKAIKDLLEAPGELNELRSKGPQQAKKFSWKKFSHETWNVYEQVLKESCV